MLYRENIMVSELSKNEVTRWPGPQGRLLGSYWELLLGELIRSYCLVGIAGFFLDEEVLNMDSADGCTVIRILC